MDDPVGEEQSGLREYALVLWRKKLTIIIVTALCVGGMLAYCAVVTPTYQATATVLLEPNISQQLIQANYPTGLPPTVNVADDIQVIESAAVKTQVRQQIPNAPTVSATQVGLTDVVQITARSSNAQLAALTANAYARAYITFERKQTIDTFTAAEALIQKRVDTVNLAITQTENQISAAGAGANTTGLASQLGRLQDQFTSLQNQLENYQFYASQGTPTEAGQVISLATTPSKPASPKTLEWTVLALIFGVVLGIGIALLINALSTRE